MFDVTGPGIVCPENLPSSVLWKQLIAVHLERTTMSNANSVEKEVNCKVIEVAPVGAIIADIISLLL